MIDTCEASAIAGIICPALNLFLLGTGIGEIYGVARVLFGGVKGAKAVAGLHRGAKGLRFLNEAEMAADVARLQQQSVLSGKVAKPGRAGAALWGRRVGWRPLALDSRAKQVNH